MEKNNKELQKKYLRFQILNQQIAQLQQQINSIENNMVELKILDNSLDEIKKVKKGNKLLMPLGSNVFIEGKLEQNKEVIMGVGSDILVKKDISNAKEIMQEQIRELEKINLQLTNEIKEFAFQFEALQKEIAKKEME